MNKQKQGSTVEYDGIHCPWSVPRDVKDGDAVYKACSCHEGMSGTFRAGRG